MVVGKLCTYTHNMAMGIFFQLAELSYWINSNYYAGFGVQRKLKLFESVNLLELTNLLYFISKNWTNRVTTCETEASFNSTL